MKKEKRSLVLLHSNDIHSHLEQAARIATIIEEERVRRHPDDLIVLDIGDHMDRMRLETEGSNGAVNVDILNQTGYEAIVLGNNEGLTFTPEQLKQAYSKKRNYEILGSNIRETESGEVPNWMLPYHILHKGELRIGLIGVTAAFSDFYELLGWNVLDPYQVVSELAATLCPQVDLLVVMSHLGLKHDRYIAEHVEGIDLILGGHTHHLFEQAEQIGHTYICAAGKFGTHLGQVEFEFDPTTRQCTVQRAVAVPTESVPEHPDIQALIQRYLETSRYYLSRTVAHLDTSMPAHPDQESALVNLLAAELRQWTEADISLVNAGQLLQSLMEGEVTLEMLHRICPSPINPCRQKLTGSQILVALEESLLPEFQQKAIKGFGFRGKVLGMLGIDGMEVYYDPNQPPYQRIQEVIVSGHPLQPEQLYMVGTLDMFTFGVGYMTLKEGTERKYYLPEFIRDLLGTALQQKDLIASSFLARWHVTQH